MSEPPQWHAANNRYLQRELRALRSLLIAQAERASQQTATLAVVPPPPPAAVRRRGWFSSLFGQDEDAAPALTPAATDRLPIAEPEPAAEAEPPELPAPALVVLAQRLGLTEFERRTLLLCAAMELDTSIGALCARAQGDLGKTWPTFALALALFEDPAWDVMSPERPLRFWRLIEINQPGVQPLVTSAIKIDERIVSYIKGLNYLDDRLAALVELVATPLEALPPSQASLVGAIGEQLNLLTDAPSLPVFQLLGPDSESKIAVALQVVATLKLALYRTTAELLPQTPGDLDSFARLWRREALLLPLALYVDATAIDTEDAHYLAIRRLLDSTSGIVFLDVRETWTDMARASVSFDVTKPTPAEQHAAWSAALDGDAAQASRLAGNFNLNLPAIREIAGRARELAGGVNGALEGRLWEGSLARARPTLNRLAQRVETKARWDELELPPTELAQLHEIAAQVRNRMRVYDEWGFRAKLARGLGISVLFAGESGTGKTMAAEAMAADLGLLLYRIDLSAVVNKYIGETEKNLRKLFDAADDGGAILLFDEADALFGKRSEVKDSHDRYANIEINYLLQRMESYRGLAILTTNMKSSLDQAFLRRLRFIVNFPFPNVEQRLGIWRKIFPPGVALGDLDLERLARLNLTGGSIQNIALNAAFMAAEADSKVTMPILLGAARGEIRKLDRPVNEADFQWLESVGGST